MDFDPVKKIVPFAVFFAVANPATFKMTRSVVGGWVANSYGLPTTAGLLLHALVFVIVAHFVWRLVWGKKTSRFGGTMGAPNGELWNIDGKYTASNARAIQGQQMHPADFDDGAGCQ